MKCPRRGNMLEIFNYPQIDKWREDDTCSYCGSLNPDEFMRRLELGDVELTPTDKTYKVYLDNIFGEPFKRTHRVDSDTTGDQTKWKWVTDDVPHAKFYFQHLGAEQKQRFVELFNEQKIKFKYPGNFYVLPFFMQWAV